MIRFIDRAFLALAIAAVGCASSSSAPSRSSEQLVYGAKVAGKGYWSEARFRFQEAVQLNPANARAHNNLAVSLEALGEFPLAFEEYKKAVSLDSASQPIRQNYTRFAEFYSAYSKKIGKVAPAP